MEMKWKGKNVLVTGATGLVGAWLTNALIDKGANVVGLVRDFLPSSKIEVQLKEKLAAVVRGDLTDYALIARCLNEYEIEFCFHLAAQTIVGVANKSPLSTFESNIRGTWNVLEAARNSKNLKGLVIASSDKAYGEHDKLPYKEDYCLRGWHPYDASKSCADLISQCYYHTYDLPIAIARCANIYGGGDLNFSRIVPGTIKSLISNEKPIIRSDGTPKRDYIYVVDAVRGYLLLAGNMGRTKGNAFNFGSNSPVTALGLVEMIIDVFGSDLKPEIRGKGRLKGEIQDQYLSVDKAKKELSWEARFSLREGLKETIEWYKEYFRLVND